jgi:glucosamine kinase
MNTVFRIGVDGGGSKTECILIDAHGKIVNRHTAPGCNPSFVGPDRARSILCEALQTLTASSAPSSIDRALLCMAGSQSFWRETAAMLGQFGRVETSPDSLPVLELATHGTPGLVLHAGTGSFVAARAPDGAVHYVGGLGWRFGDPASGHDLGRRAIARVMLELQGWSTDSARRMPGGGNRSPLAQALCEYTGTGDYGALSRFFYSDTEVNAKIVGFAPRVIELAERDDALAQQIVAESLSELAFLVNRVIENLFPLSDLRDPQPLIPCGVSGVLLNRAPCIQTLRSLAATYAWPIQIQTISEAPIEGVRRLLLRET